MMDDARDVGSAHGSARKSRPPILRRLYACLIAIVGLTLAIGGAYLLMLGGSPYYLLTGLAVLGSAVLLWLGHREGVRLYAAMLVATVAWAIWESGFSGWALFPRIGPPMILGVPMAFPAFRRKLTDMPGRWALQRRLATSWAFAGSLALAVLLGTGLHALRAPVVDPAFSQVASTSGLTGSATATASAAGDWTSYGGDLGGSRHSALDQITPANVGQLKVAWTYHIGFFSKGATGSLEVTPLKIGNTLYLCSGLNDIVALDADTGRQRWRFFAHANGRGITAGACRGVAYYKADKPVADCPERIITATVDARLLAVDAQTGKLCQSFGNGGQVSLLTGMGQVTPGYYYVSSAPAIARGKIVFGGYVSDGQYWGEPSGVIRAFDAITGKFAWAFDMGRPNDHGEPGPGQEYTRATVNSWGPISADDGLGLVYLPTGNATPDYYAPQRRAFDDEYSGSILALDSATGAKRWVFQTTHHGLWDYDVPSEPTLIDFRTAAGVQRALISSTKRGEIFVLDRATGRPLSPVVERPAPQKGHAPGERLSPTQPFSVGMPSFRGPDLREDMMWGVTPIDQMICRIRFRTARYQGTLTPPGLTPYIDYPGGLGGVDWGGVSVDPGRNLLIVNSDRIASRNRLITRADANKMGLHPKTARSTGDTGGPVPQAGTPYAAVIESFLSPIGAPCQQPPYGMLTAVDLATRKVVWTHSLGTAYDSGVFGVKSHLNIPMGVPNLGGSITTASGLIFIGATQEQAFRAVDTRSGKILWKARLPAGGQATPMTYRAASGRQFVVIAAGGNEPMKSGNGDSIVAYALPAR